MFLFIFFNSITCSSSKGIFSAEAPLITNRVQRYSFFLIYARKIAHKSDFSDFLFSLLPCFSSRTGSKEEGIKCGEKGEEDERGFPDGRLPNAFTDRFCIGFRFFHLDSFRSASSGRYITSASFAIERSKIRCTNRGKRRGCAYPIPP